MAQVAVGDFNGDGRRDLAVGVPGEFVDRGQVNIIYGAGTGLSATAGPGIQTFDQSRLVGGWENDDAFGSSLAAGDFNGDGRADLAVGVPNEQVGSVGNAGAVNVIYGSSTGLSATAGPGNQLWHQNSSGIAGSAEPNDHFGAVLSAWNFGLGSQADLVIGIPDEDLGDKVDAGAVTVMYGRASGLSSANSQLWAEDSPGVAGDPEDGDRFGGAIY